MPRSRSVEKRLTRRRRGQVLERSYQRLKRVANYAAVFTAGSVALIMALQLFAWPTSGSLESGPLAHPILRHYALIIPVLLTSFFGAAFAFRFLAPTHMLAVWRLLLPGALFAIAAYLSFFPAVDFAGATGGVLWLLLLAIAISYAGTLVWQRPR